MLNEQSLRTIFEKAYNRPDWYHVLRQNFGVETLREPATDISVRIKTNDYKANAYELGSFDTPKGQLVGLYEVQVQNAQLYRNRRALRDLLDEIYRTDVDAALVVFIQGAKWRFTYVSEITVRNPSGKRERRVTDPKRYTYLFGEGEKALTAARQFFRIKPTEDLFGKGISLEVLKEAFNVEKMSTAFFNEYRKHYGSFTAYLTSEDENSKEVCRASPFLKSTFNGDKKKARDFIKKMLGRIVFLYFLEKKGWLGVPVNATWGKGDENFLSHLFAESGVEQDVFYSNVLAPLFFGALNTKRKDDLFELAGKKLKIPFLNGGLFEEDQAKTQLLTFPKDLFSALFEFFDRYNFTVYEDSPDEHTIAVDPEMLGHIFENLLEDNKDKGAFYTPKKIVYYMCQESLIEYLHTKLNQSKAGTALARTANRGQAVKREELEAFIKQGVTGPVLEYEEALLTALYTIKVCDPAIGSGAFPMGILMEIFHAVETLFEASAAVTKKVWKLTGHDWVSNRAPVKAAIIQNSIYGVDIEQGAVDIARLRFWLSLVVDEDKPQPLPNLDYKIVVGNSLLSKFEDEVIHIDWNINTAKATEATRLIITQQASKLNTLQSWQTAFFNHSGNKAKFQLDIRDIKIDILVNQLMLSRISFQQANPRLGGFAPTAKEIQKNLDNEFMIKGYDRTIKKLEAIKKNKNERLQFFDWKLDYPEVMNDKVQKDAGFDIVIANPPYVDIKGLPDDLVDILFDNFETAENRINLYSIFIEKSWTFLKRNGTMTFINPNSLLLNSSYTKIRRYIVDGLEKIIKLPDNVFVNAIVETIIFQAKKHENSAEVLGAFYKNDEKINFNKLNFQTFQTNDWKADTNCRFNIFISTEINNILKKIDNSQVEPIDKYFDFTLGITPYDKHKGHTPAIIENRAYHSKEKLNKNYVPLLSGSNIARFAIEGNIEEYLYYGDWLGAPRQLKFFTSPRVIVRQIVSGQPPRIYAAYTEKELYHTQIGFSIIQKQESNYSPRFLCAILNSNLISFYHKSLAF